MRNDKKFLQRKEAKQTVSDKQVTTIKLDPNQENK